MLSFLCHASQPVNGVISRTELIRGQVAQAVHDPAAVRRALEELEEAAPRAGMDGWMWMEGCSPIASNVAGISSSVNGLAGNHA